MMKQYIPLVLFLLISCSSGSRTRENILFLDEMEVGETVRFDLSSLGCFSSNTFELSVLKLMDHYTVIYKNKPHKLSSQDFEIIRGFEKKLRETHSHQCSRTNKYLITNTTTHKTFKNIDESCNWSGFFNLIKALNLKI